MYLLRNAVCLLLRYLPRARGDVPKWSQQKVAGNSIAPLDGDVPSDKGHTQIHRELTPRTRGYSSLQSPGPKGAPSAPPAQYELQIPSNPFTGSLIRYF